MLDPDAVRSRDDLARFINDLRAELPTRWESHDLGAYLEAMAAWTADMPGWFENRGESEPAEPTWSLVASMLVAASLYE